MGAVSDDDSKLGSRRDLLRVVSVVGGGAAAAAVVAPVLQIVIDPAAKTTVSGTGRFVPVAELEAIPTDGTPLCMPVVVQAPKDGWNLLPPTEVGSVWLQATDGSKDGVSITAFSTVCPHLGCAIDWEADSGRYICPCHDSYFEKDGRVGTGPSPRPMDSLETRVVGTTVEVKFEKFALGIVQKRTV